MSRDLLTLMGVTLHHDDCVARMRLMADASVDAIVTDPPYELGFMGKGWDKSGIANSVEMWREALRVLKPGGHLLAFSGTRTYHRMTCAIEDAGFEVRDQIGWLYASGFPKSLDVSKAIDKAAGAEREVVGVAGKSGSSRSCMAGDFAGGEYMATAPATDAARQWQGWGTALKPAWEPICVARKPLDGTVAANVLAHGTGALNIDGCRVEGGERPLIVGGNEARKFSGDFRQGSKCEGATTAGRWPANLIHDGSDEVLGAFPHAPGQMANVSTTAPSEKTSNVYGRMKREGEPSADSENEGAVGFKMKPGMRRLDTGSAARFMYCAKASKRDRDEGLDHLPAVHRPNGNKWTDQDYRVANGERSEGREAGPRRNIHPTVKPTDLMRYLCRLVTPPGGVVLDPFMGSGSTGKAAMLEGFQFVGIDMTAEYVAIAEARIAAALTQA